MHGKIFRETIGLLDKYPVDKSQVVHRKKNKIRTEA
jgi:hypothetical protein